jgi:hypothetical protein
LFFGFRFVLFGRDPKIPFSRRRIRCMNRYQQYPVVTLDYRLIVSDIDRAASKRIP